MPLVDSVEKFSINLTNGNTTASATLTQGQTLANCVPFITARITGTNTTARSDRYSVDAYMLFDSPDNTVVVETFASDRTMTVEVCVVEFNSTAATVTPVTWIGDGDETISAVTLANSFVVSGVRNSDTLTQQTTGAMRIGLESTTSVGFRRDSTATGSVRGHAYVVESDGTSFTVQHNSNWNSTGSSGSDTITTVNPDKTMVIASYQQTLTFDNRELPYFRLASGGGSVEFSKSGSTADNQFNYQVVSFDPAGDQWVQRGLFNTGATPPDTETLGRTVTTLASTMARTPLQGNGFNGQSTGTAEVDAGDVKVSLKLTDASTLSFDHSSEGGETSINVAWEVVEWENGPAVSTTRRVFSVS